MNRAVQSKLAGLSIVALAVVSGAARAELTSTITIATDYDFRGITQTALDPALQASLDWSGESGLYAGVWASNVDFGRDGGEGKGYDEVDLDAEVDFTLGYAGSITEDLGYDVGATYYKYIGDTDGGVNDFDYYEVYAGLGYRAVSAKLWYSPDFANASESAWYIEANAEIPLPAEFGLVLHAGYNFGDYWKPEAFGLDEYFDYSIGLTRSFGHFDFTVSYIDGSDLKETDGTAGDIGTSESKFHASVSTTFPWSR